MNSQELDKISPALVAAIAEMPAVEMDATGQVGNRKYKYTTLGAVIAATRPILAKYKLAVTQQVTSNDTGDAVGVRTVIIHDSGQFMSWDAVVKIPLDDSPGQEAGKLITYLRRYSLAAALNIYSDEDLDAANTQSQQNSKRKRSPQPEPFTILDAAKVTDRNGTPYTEIESERLSHMSRSIDQAIRSNGHDPECKAELVRKQQAVKVILQARTEGAIK